MTGLEALERYHRLDVLVETDKDLTLKDDEEYKILKQALLKAQEQEKVLEIIKEKNVNVYYFKDELAFWNLSYKYYINSFSSFHNGLTIKMLDEEEFELLKRYFNE